MSRKKMQKKTITKKLIRSALATLLEANSLDEITVQQIVEKALINRSTFYLHYQDKYDLYDSLVQELLNDLQEVLETTPLYNLETIKRIAQQPDQTLDITDQFLKHIETNKDLYTVLITDQVFQKKFVTIISDNMYKGNNLPRIITNHIAYGSTGTILEWLTKDTPYSSAYISKLLSRFSILEILEYKNLKV